MRRITSLSLGMCMALVLSCGVSFANEAVALDDIVNGQTTQQSGQGTGTVAPPQTDTTVTPQVSTPQVNQTQQTNQTQPQTNQPQVAAPQTGGTQVEANQFMDNLSEAGDLSGESETARKVAEPMVRIIAIAVQILSYFITAGLALRVALDLTFIGLPFTRVILANGHVGNPQAGSNTMGNPMQGGMNNGMNGMSGMGGMGMGMGGMGSRYGGMGGMNGMGMGMGMGGMGVNGTSNTGAADAGSSAGRIQFVSSAALNAAAAETTVGPDGKAVGPFKIYAKDMIAILVITPILLVLAVTGALTQLGYLIGSLIGSMLGSIGGMM